MTIAVAFTRHTIPLLFLGSDGAANGETIALAATLLVVGATFFVTDGAQSVIAGALRGLNDTRVPARSSPPSASGSSAFAASYAARASRSGYGAIGVWIGLSIGTSVYAALLLWRFRALTRSGLSAGVPGHRRLATRSRRPHEAGRRLNCPLAKNCVSSRRRAGTSSSGGCPSRIRRRSSRPEWRNR